MAAHEQSQCDETEQRKNSDPDLLGMADVLADDIGVDAVIVVQAVPSVASNRKKAANISDWYRPGYGRKHTQNCEKPAKEYYPTTIAQEHIGRA